MDRSNPRVTAVHVFDGEVVARQPNRLDNQAVYLTKGQSASASHGRREVVQTTQSLEKIKRFSNIAISQGMLPGTGVGLRVGQVDPNWAVVEMDGRVLDTPRPVEVITAPQHTGPLFDASHLKASQMVGFVPDHGADPNQPYVFQTSFDIPESIDIDSTVLQLRYAADIYLEWVRINGQRLRLDHAATGWGRFEQSTITQHLQPGKNTVAFEVSNFNPRSESEVDLGAVGLRLEWSLRSVSTANPTTDGGGP